MRTERTDVLIVGGGLVGLSMAAFLAWHGVPTVLVEKHSGVPTHPRARGTNPRTMEMLRTIGLEDRVRASGSARALAANSGVIAVESLAGREIGALRHAYHADSGADYASLSPTSWCLCHQDELEPLLRDRARELGADVRFGTELTDLTDHGETVLAVTHDRATGTPTAIEAAYVVAADGADSPVRHRLGIPMDGPGVLARFVNIAFHADLREPLGDRRFIICYTAQAGKRCALLPVDNASRWLLHVLDPGSEPFDEARCVALVRAAAGVPDLDVRIVSVLPWDAAAAVARRLRSGRIFLVGDAAHVMPPSGAFGSNTGIADAHNLAWKLAAVLRAEADPALLDSYDRERRPAAAATVRQAVLRSRERPRLVDQDAGPPDPEIRPDPVVIFGYRYPTEPAPADGGWLDTPDGTPGSRAPHVWLATGDHRASTLDRYGRDLVLLTGGPGWDDVVAGLDRPVTLHRIGTDAARPHDPDGRWAAAHGVEPAGAVLVRPDGIVWWRWTGAPDGTAARSLESALHRLLGRVPAAL